MSHIPVVRHFRGWHHIVCERCGLMLDFRPLESLNVYTEDWDADAYRAPDDFDTAPCSQVRARQSNEGVQA